MVELEVPAASQAMVGTLVGVPTTYQESILAWRAYQPLSSIMKSVTVSTELQKPHQPAPFLPFRQSLVCYFAMPLPLDQIPIHQLV